MGEARKQYYLERMQSKRYRDAFVDANIRAGIARQVRAMREARGWTQAELAGRAGMRVELIEECEANCRGVTLGRLRRLAQTFDVALSVRVVPFSELVDQLANMQPEDLDVPGFDKDEGLKKG